MNVWKHAVAVALVCMALASERVAAQWQLQPAQPLRPLQPLQPQQPVGGLPPKPAPQQPGIKIPDQKMDEPGVDSAPGTRPPGSHGIPEDQFEVSTPLVGYVGMRNNRHVFWYQGRGNGDYFQVRWGRPGMNEIQHKYNYGYGRKEFEIPEDALPNVEYVFRVQAGASGKHFGTFGMKWTSWASTTWSWRPGKKGPPEITQVVEKDGLRFYYRPVGESEGYRITWFRKGYAAKVMSVPLFRTVGNMTIRNESFEIPEKLKYGTEYTFRIQSVYANGTFSNWAEKKHVTKPDPRPVDVSTKSKAPVQAPLQKGMADNRTSGPVQAPLQKGMVEPRKVGSTQAIESVKPKTPAPTTLPKPRGTAVAAPSSAAGPAAGAMPASSVLTSSKNKRVVQSQAAK